MAIAKYNVGLALMTGFCSRGALGKPRLQYPGAIYHVMSDHQEGIVADDYDRLLFLTALGEVYRKTAS